MLRLITLVSLGLLAASPFAYAGKAFTQAYQQAAALAQQGRFEEAQVSMTAGLELASNPEEALDGWKLMADLYEKQGKPEQALKAYQQASEQQAELVERQNRAIERASEAVEASKQQIEAMNAEQAALEQQLQALGGDQ
ncbi:MAG: tetratricopeptide repeat protein [Lysobacteraceae bacterium]